MPDPLRRGCLRCTAVIKWETSIARLKRETTVERSVMKTQPVPAACRGRPPGTCSLCVQGGFVTSERHPARWPQTDTFFLTWAALKTVKRETTPPPKNAAGFTAHRWPTFHPLGGSRAAVEGWTGRADGCSPRVKLRGFVFCQLCGLGGFSPLGCSWPDSQALTSSSGRQGGLRPHLGWRKARTATSKGVIGRQQRFVSTHSSGPISDSAVFKA